MNAELIWFALPAAGALHMAGGTWWKPFRRIGCPMIVAAAAFLFAGWSWWWLLLFAGSFAAYSLPFTLKGNAVSDFWFNWIWIWLAGYIIGLPAAVVGIAVHKIGLSLLLCLVPFFIQGIVGTLSNLAFSRNAFPWKFCEFLIGTFAVFPTIMLIHLHIS